MRCFRPTWERPSEATIALFDSPRHAHPAHPYCRVGDGLTPLIEGGAEQGGVDVDARAPICVRLGSFLQRLGHNVQLSVVHINILRLFLGPTSHSG
ncbi:MAG: hypothetical protein ACJATT_004008, partial [Myxococcota bacterium]